MSDAEVFARERGRLLGLAYRMVGRLVDAEDLVQEAWLRWSNVATNEVVSPRAYLTQVVTRLCLDHLSSAPVRREQTVGVDLPEPLDEAGTVALDDLAAASESLTVAFLVMLQKLSPPERAVYLLREVFEHDYDEVARVTGKSSSACRQIVRRAKEHLGRSRRRFPAEHDDAVVLVARFAEATRRGDVVALLELLAPDVTLYAASPDAPTYGRARATARPIAGRDAVVQFLLAIQGQAPDDVVTRVATTNGRPSLLTYVDGELIAVISYDLADAETLRIDALFVQADPTRLQGLGPLRFLS